MKDKHHMAQQEDVATYRDEEIALLGILDDTLPRGIGPCKGWPITKNKKRTLRSGQGDVHTALILYETDRLLVGARTNGRQNDDGLFLTLKTVDGTDATITDECSDATFKRW